MTSSLRQAKARTGRDFRRVGAIHPIADYDISQKYAQLFINACVSVYSRFGVLVNFRAFVLVEPERVSTKSYVIHLRALVAKKPVMLYSSSMHFFATVGARTILHSPSKQRATSLDKNHNVFSITRLESAFALAVIWKQTRSLRGNTIWWMVGSKNSIPEYWALSLTMVITSPWHYLHLSDQNLS